MPGLGGSKIILSDFKSRLFIISSILPAIAEKFSISFSFAFSKESFAAASFSSIPATSFALSARERPMLPVPEYRSKTFSSPFKFANSIII